MLIHKAKKTDLKELPGLLKQLGYPTDLKTFQKRVKSLNSKSDLLLVAIKDNKVVGFVSLHLIPLVHENGFLSRVTALVVDESYQKQGVGKALLKKAESYALKNGAADPKLPAVKNALKPMIFI